MFKTLWRRVFPSQNRACPGGEKTLNDARAGERVRIECLRGEEGVCQRLREMGFCESAVVRKISDNGAIICRVADSRVAISQALARNIIVKNCPSH